MKTPLWQAFLAGVVVGALLLLGFFWVLDLRAENQLQEKVRAANERADEWRIAYNRAGEYWTERAHQYVEAEAVRDSLKEENRALVEDLERAEARVVSASRSVSRLEARLDSSRSTVGAVGDSTYKVALDEAVYLDGGGHLRVRGDVRIRIVDPPTVRSDLGVRGRFPLTVVLSELPEGDIRVDAYTGDPRLTVDSLNVTYNRRDGTPDGGSVLASLGEHLLSGSSWVSRAEGLAIGLFLCR